ncbi:hypothetical protein U1Q18_027044 [Sarracenia purpurea var. burkii]
MANKFSMLGTINSDEYDKCFPLLAGTKSESRSSSRVLRTVKCNGPVAIMDEADSIRKTLLGVSSLPKDEMIVVRSVAKSIEKEVNILRKGELLILRDLRFLRNESIISKEVKARLGLIPFGEMKIERIG